MHLTRNIFSAPAFALMLLLTSCSSTTMQPTQQAKPGFSNVTDIPLPESATMNLKQSMITGSGKTWAGHLVYDTTKSQPQVIDFICEEMHASGWSKLGDLRGKETTITFMKNKRLATVRVTSDPGFLAHKTSVSIDMTNSDIRHAIVSAQQDEV